MLKTEERNPATCHISDMETGDMVRLLQEESAKAVAAVAAAGMELTQAVDAIATRMKRGGRLFYVGCGTSGRLGVLDASECPPTYGVSPDTVIGIIAGGDTALRYAVEKVEDNEQAGRQCFEGYSLTPEDAVVGISASGGASFVLGALAVAAETGALTVAVANNRGTDLERAAEIAIVAETGAEPITGSTRMKAGTAQKLILNTLSTCVMVRMGYVYENMMVNLCPTNKKLRQRMIRIVSDILKCPAERSEELLEQSGWTIRAAIRAGDKAS